MNRDAASTLLEAIGVVSVLTAASAADWRLGLALLGCLLVVAGYLLSEGEA